MTPRIDETTAAAAQAAAYAEYAREWLESADQTASRPGAEWPVVCKQLQEAGACALKALHTALRSETIHDCGMTGKWRQAEGLGEEFAAKINAKLVDRIDRYGGEDGYGTPSDQIPRERRGTSGRSPRCWSNTRNAARRN